MEPLQLRLRQRTPVSCPMVGQFGVMVSTIASRNSAMRLIGVGKSLRRSPMSFR